MKSSAYARLAFAVFLATSLPNASFQVPVMESGGTDVNAADAPAERSAAGEADNDQLVEDYAVDVPDQSAPAAADEGTQEEDDAFVGRQNLDVQSIINNLNAEKQDETHSHGHHGEAANLFNAPTPPRPSGLFGFTFPYVNPISILLQPFRFIASTLFGGFRRSAVATVNSNGGVTGELVFSQLFPTFPVMISGRITGLTPGEHAFHVHEFGDLREGCLKAGDHYDPFRSVHAAPSSLRRHVGDLGNIIADNDGVARVSILDHRLTLYGPFSILGRSVVVHAARDDLGVGGNPSSGVSGNAGDRVACAVIGGGR